MPNQSAVIILVGHGSLSGQKTTIPIHSYLYNVILPVVPNEVLCRFGHDVLVQNLASFIETNELQQKISALESLPGTAVVAHKNKPQNLTYDIADRKHRQEVEKLLQEIEIASTSSKHAWELFEHRVAPAEDILGAPTTYFPSRALPNRYLECDLVTKAFLDAAPNAITLHFLIDCLNLFKQIGTKSSVVESVLAQQYKTTNGETLIVKHIKIDDGQVVYITPRVPYGSANASQHFELSTILDHLPKMHIFVASTKDPAHNTIYRIYEVAHEEVLGRFMFNTNFGDEWYDVTIPEDANIILGMCRVEDSAF